MKRTQTFFYAPKISEYLWYLFIYLLIAESHFQIMLIYILVNNEKKILFIDRAIMYVGRR